MFESESLYCTVIAVDSNVTPDDASLKYVAQILTHAHTHRPQVDSIYMETVFFCTTDRCITMDVYVCLAHSPEKPPPTLLHVMEAEY